MTMFSPPVYCEIDVFSHGFTVRVKNPMVTRHIRNFISKYALYGFIKDKNGKRRYTPTSYLCDETMDKSIFTFHIEQYKPFISMLDYIGYGDDRRIVRKWGHKEFKTFDMNIKSHIELRDYQKEAAEFAQQKRTEAIHSALLAMPTGTGKTLTALYLSCIYKQRTAVFVRSTFVKQWYNDIQKNTDTQAHEILEIQGGGTLRALMAMTEDDLKDIKFIIFSEQTMCLYFDDYVAADCVEGDYGYSVSPHGLLPHLNIGMCIFDEMHEAIKQVYRCLIYCHVPFVVGLSATFMAQEQDIVEMQSLLVPECLRFTDIQMKKYIDCYSLGYRFKHYDPKRIKTTAMGNTMYSHDAFEASIIRNKAYLKGYLDMIAYVMRVLYKGDYDDYKPGDKAVVYAFKKDMCDLIIERLKEQYPELDIRRFVSGDPYDNVIKPDIRVTTIGSFGAGKDVPDLCFSLLTNSVNKPSANIQILGRLREIAGTKVKLAFIWCAQINKHVEYADEKMKWFKPRTASLAKYTIADYV